MPTTNKALLQEILDEQKSLLSNFIWSILDRV